MLMTEEAPASLPDSDNSESETFLDSDLFRRTASPPNSLVFSRSDPPRLNGADLD
jgi:hypothetical protein